jgi:hypothetical protein
MTSLSRVLLKHFQEWSAELQIPPLRCGRDDKGEGGASIQI